MILMLEYYPLLKLSHICLVLLSGLLFLLRGVLLFVGSSLGRGKGLKRLSYVNDSFLLLAGLGLLWVPVNNPFHNPWLFVKWGLLIVYIGLGIYAFRLGRSDSQRLAGFVVALLVYLFMFSIARLHHPLGIFSLFF
jgi:uncharacterized membrane protein SirB2